MKTVGETGRCARPRQEIYRRLAGRIWAPERLEQETVS